MATFHCLHFVFFFDFALSLDILLMLLCHKLVIVNLKRISEKFYAGHSILLILALYSLPVAAPLVLNTCTVISVDDGLLRTSTGCAGPASSSILYVD